MYSMTLAQVVAWTATALAANQPAGLRAATLRREDKEATARDFDNMLGIERRVEAYDMTTPGGSVIRVSRPYVELR